MTEIQNKTNSKNKNIVILYVILFFSCSSLIVINYITIRILSASRAYVYGESSYSKGQNIASRHLITYLYTENEKHWVLFNNELRIPLGDQLARVTLIKNNNDALAKIGFRVGKNKEEDLDDMIWIFKNFKSVPFLKEAINEWAKADELINQLHKRGIEIHKRITTEKLDESTKHKITSEISILCEKLTTTANEFSNIVGNGTRKIKDNLIVINVFFILLILSSVSIYYIITLKKIITSEKVIKNKKEQLHDIIEDLEKTKIELSTEIIQHKKLIGSISHDIKSPLKYLAMTSKYIYEESNNFDDVKYKKNTKSVYSSTLQLYNFIDSLLTYSKIFFEGKNTENSFFNMRELIETKCDLFKEIAAASNNVIVNEIDNNLVSKLNKDLFAVILHNIIDNAIKYTENGVIKISSHIKTKKLYIVVEDTGVGFKEKDLIYYNQLCNEQSAEKLIIRNSGMGLPMIIELIYILNGNLQISNNSDKGSKIEIITDII